jgi:hypothetical protein
MSLHPSDKSVASISVCCGIILLATLIPRGALSFNPLSLDSPKEEVENVATAPFTEDRATGGEEERGPEDVYDELKPTYAEKQQSNA